MNCIFCDLACKKMPSYIIYEDNTIMAFLDSAPINEGHILVIPKQHYLDVDEVPLNVLTDILGLVQKIVKAMKVIYKPDGYSIMQNGGAFNDIGHYHVHIFPRYKGDGFGWTYSNESFIVNEEIANNLRQMLNGNI